MLDTMSPVCATPKRVYFFNRDLLCRSGSNYGLTEDVIMALAKQVEKRRKNKPPKTKKEVRESKTPIINFIDNKWVEIDDERVSMGAMEYAFLKCVYEHQQNGKLAGFDEIQEATEMPTDRKSVQNIITRIKSKTDKIGIAIRWNNNCVAIEQREPANSTPR